MEADMEIRTLRYFMAVANEENITRAAEYLHVSQPTLSRQLMELEEEFGETLLIRGKRKVTLTDKGILLRSRAQEILDLVDKTVSDMSDDSKHIGGTIHFGAGETDGVRLIMKTAAELQADHPDIHYNFFSGDATSVVDHLDKGLIDFGLVFGSYDRNKYYIMDLPYEDSWCVLMRSDDPLSEKDSITADDLIDKPLILSRQSTEEGVIQTWLGHDLIDLNIFCIYNLILNASKIVSEGLGYALALEALIPVDGLSGLTSRPIKPAITDRLRIIWKKNQVLTPAAELFLQKLRDNYCSI